MDMQEFTEGCKNCDPVTEPERAAELLKAAAELGAAILAQRKKASKVDCKQVVELYNAKCGAVLPKVTKITDKRKRSIKLCLAQYSLNDLATAFDIAIKTPFLTGTNDRLWKANFDFIIKPDNMVKILEGVYGHAVQAADEHSYDLNKLLDHAMNNVPKI